MTHNGQIHKERLSVGNAWACSGCKLKGLSFFKSTGMRTSYFGGILNKTSKIRTQLQETLDMRKGTSRWKLADGTHFLGSGCMPVAFARRPSIRSWRRSKLHFAEFSCRPADRKTSRKAESWWRWLLNVGEKTIIYRDNISMWAIQNHVEKSPSCVRNWPVHNVFDVDSTYLRGRTH